MRRIGLVLGGALFAVALGLAVPKIAGALGANTAPADLAPYAIPSPMAPGIPTKVTLAGAASAGTSVTAGSCVRISCTVDCAYRVTAGSSTATTDDNQLPSQTPERFCLTNAQTNITFYSSSAGSAYVAVAVP